MQKKATIKFGNLPVIEGLPTLIFQLFYNLLSNSLKFSKKDVPCIINITAYKLNNDEVVELGLTSSLNYYKIDVQDNGIGFDEEHADQIFDSFSRLHSKDRFEGTGLGLSLCKKIVIRHKGQIKAASLPDAGATFSIILPERQSQ